MSVKGTARTTKSPPNRPSGQSVIRNWVLPSDPWTVNGAAGVSAPALGRVLGSLGVTGEVTVPNPCPTTLTFSTWPLGPRSSATVPTGNAVC